MDDLLFLVHRIPFPPNKGDKIRSYRELKHLGQRYRIHLGTFIDDPDDAQYIDEVKALCAETCILPLRPLPAKLMSLSGLLQGTALTLPYYRNTAMQQWVDRQLATRRIRHALVFSSAMAQYLEGRAIGRRVIDFVDVDSDKWRQYAQSKPWPLSLLYRREARKLLAYERAIAAEFDSATFVSAAEAALFRQLSPESARKIDYFNNGVDAAYFSPRLPHANPYPAGALPIVFTGAMDYWANADAVSWFSHEVFPLIRARRPQAMFCIVGARPTPQVLSLGRADGIIVTGSVPDVRPYIAHAAVSVAPLRIARGVQNKVLEAMAMAKTVIASPEAAEGIQAVIGSELLVAKNAAEFAEAVLSQLQPRRDHKLGHSARERVVHDYSWESGMNRLEALLSGPPATCQQTPFAPAVPDLALARSNPA